METSTEQTTKALALQFDLHTRLFNNVLDGIVDAEANSRASETVNHIKWLAGHLTSTRYSMKPMANAENDDSYADLFAHGNGIQDNVEYPSIEAIKNNWNSISEALATGLQNMPQEALSSPAPTQTPVNDTTLGGFLAFLMHHEAYHLGQMGILRKYAGKEAMSYS